MACVWFSVIVFVMINEVFAGEDLNNIKNCNECIRSGGSWCNDNVKHRCAAGYEDSWCPGGREELPSMSFSSPGMLINPRYEERTLYINKADALDIQYPGPDVLKVVTHVINTTQSENIQIEVAQNTCPSPNSPCTVTIKTIPSKEFCLPDGERLEYFYVTLRIGTYEETVVRYYVNCGCACSLNTVPNAVTCHRHGDYSCGTCTCHEGWSGEFCDETVCERERGDQNCVPMTNSEEFNRECAGNGHCVCGSCICNTDVIGAQYFDYHCMGICQRIIDDDCERCILNHTDPDCGKCKISVHNYTESLTNAKDAENRPVWVPCHVVVDECDVNYVIKKDDNGGIHVMVVNTCNDVVAGAVVATNKVPIILGVLAVLAVLAAVAGVMVWKHMNALPPVLPNDSQYTNIDAEDCTGENPLYKPPTSSYKNPMFGKW